MPVKIVPGPFGSRSVEIIPERPKRPRPQGRMARQDGRMIAIPLPEAPRFIVGLDLGQAADWTAIVAVERSETGFTVPLIERVKGIPYPQIVAGLVVHLARPELAGNHLLVVDATGVGRPVVDMLRTARLQPIPLTITGGAKVTGTRRAPHVPKVDLVEGLLVAFQNGQISIASALPNAAMLMRELAEMRRKTTASGGTKYDARDGEHDDLVLALAMAFWIANRRTPGPGSVQITPMGRRQPNRDKDASRQALADAVR